MVQKTNPTWDPKQVPKIEPDSKMANMRQDSQDRPKVARDRPKTDARQAQESCKGPQSRPKKAKNKALKSLIRLLRAFQALKSLMRPLRAYKALKSLIRLLRAL